MSAELRAILAIARKDLTVLSRYRLVIASMVFVPLYQGVIPAFLFGAAFAVGGRAVGLQATTGTDNLAGYIFLGGVVSGLVASSFWGMAMSVRNEMDQGTLEATWLTPTRHESFVLGRAIASMALFLASQVALFTIGIAFFGLRFSAEIVYAIPAVLIATAGMVGIAYMLAACVLLLREANFFVDTTNFLFGVASGVAFPITLLPGLVQPIAFALPTTYAVDILRQHGIGGRPLFEPALEYAVLVAGTVLAYPLGRWCFAQADHVMRVRGTLGQH